MQDEQGRRGKERRECVETVKGKGKMKVGRGKGGPASRKHMARRNPGRGTGKEWGAQNTNTGVSFLNLLGVCRSNKDKGSNDYSVKSMVLDFANTN